MVSVDQAGLVESRLDALLAANPPRSTPEHRFWAAQFDLGLAWVQFPEGRGGLGVAPAMQQVVFDRLLAARAPISNIRRNLLGYGMGAPTLIAHGKDEQLSRWLRPLFTADEIWCQLFSEPGAGSDLAGLSTSAVRDGDEWIISGQKVWSTFAHLARWGMLVARHDSSLPKHAGLTYFVVDMTAPGVEVRPLRQMTGEAEFNEVYLTEVRVPDGNRIGAVGEGWSVSLTTLMNERVAIGSNPLARGEGPIAGAVTGWQRLSDGSDSLRRDRLMRLWCEAEVLRLTGRRAARGAMSGTPGPAGSTTKLQWAELNRKIGEFCVDLLAADGMLYPDGYALSIPDQESGSHHSDQMRFLRARANSIEGGTSEIMRNILGERVLGLPGEPRVDRDLPWSQIPR